MIDALCCITVLRHGQAFSVRGLVQGRLPLWWTGGKDQAPEAGTIPRRAESLVNIRPAPNSFNAGACLCRSKLLALKGIKKNGTFRSFWGSARTSAWNFDQELPLLKTSSFLWPEKVWMIGEAFVLVTLTEVMEQARQSQSWPSSHSGAMWGYLGCSSTLDPKVRFGSFAIYAAPPYEEELYQAGGLLTIGRVWVIRMKNLISYKRNQILIQKIN